MNFSLNMLAEPPRRQLTNSRWCAYALLISFIMIVGQVSGASPRQVVSDSKPQLSNDSKKLSECVRDRSHCLVVRRKFKRRADQNRPTLQILSATTTKPILDLWSPISYRDELLPVKGSTGDLIIPPTYNSLEDPAAGFAPTVEGMVRPLEEKFIGQPLLTERRDNKSVLLSSDLRRLLKFEDGDLWKSEFDWAQNQIKPWTQVTDFGFLEDLTPIVWSGNVLYLKNKKAAERPVVKIDIAHGDVEEIAGFSCLNDSNYSELAWKKGIAFVAPNNRVMIYLDGEKIVLTDLQTGDSKTLLNVIKYHHPTDKNDYLRNCIPLIKEVDFGSYRKDYTQERSAIWYDDDTLIAVSANGIVVLNTRLGTLTPFNLGLPVIGPYTYTSTRARVDRVRVRARVGDRVWATIYNPGQPLGDSPKNYGSKKRHVLIDTMDGSMETLPATVDKALFWLTPEQYLYPVREGKFSQTGTWLHNIATGARTRISIRHDLELFRGNDFAMQRFVYCQASQRLFFKTPDSWWLFDFKGNKETRLREWDSVASLCRFDFAEFDLGLDSTSPPAWSNELPVSWFAKEDQYTFTDTMLFEKNLAGLPVSIQKQFRSRIQNSNGTIRKDNGYDPALVTAAFIKRLNEQGGASVLAEKNQQVSEILQEAISSVPPSKQRVRAGVFDSYVHYFLSRGKTWQSYSADQRARIVSEMLKITDSFLDEHASNSPQTSYSLKKRRFKIHRQIKAFRETFLE